MSYSYDKFLRPITTTDKNIQIIDNNGIVKYTINPFSVINVMISNNLLKINMKQGRVILINFSSSNESKLAISRIQEQLDILREKTPSFIDKQVESYFSGIDTHLIPSIDSVYDLGSTSSQWRSLHVSSNTIYLGGVTISATGSFLTVNGTPLNSGASVNDENTIYVRKEGGDFLTIKDAVDSITTASSSNPYVIKVGGGIYQEDPIQMKSYVSVFGESSVSTIIEAINPNSTLIIGADQSIIADCQIQGCTGSGVAAVVYSSPTTPQRDAIFYVENVRFGENYTHAKVIGTASGNCIMQCSNVKYGGYPFTVGFYVTNAGTGIGRMQLRNVTSTNGGITTTSGLIFAKADKPGCTFIVNGCLLTKAAGGNVAGTGFWVENGGSLRLTAVNFQRWATAIYAPNVGSAPSIFGTALNFENGTKDVLIEHPTATGKLEGTDTHSKVTIPIDAPLYEVNQDPRVINVAKKGGDFTSLSSAVASITDSSEENRYVIKVGPGKYTENEINLLGKPYVSIVGSDIQTTTIEPNSDTHSVFVLGDTNEISFMTIQGAGSGYAGIECVDTGGFALAHKISMYDCDTMVLVRCTDLETPVQFFGEYLDINGTYTYGIKAESIVGNYDVASNGYSTFVNLENYYAAPTTDSISNHASGIGTQLTIQGGSLTGIKSTDTGFYIEDGSSLSLESVDIMGFDKALHAGTSSISGDIGSAPTFECVGVIIKDSSGSVSKDLFIEHPYTSGLFQGVASHNNISNLSPDVSWSFLDSIDGEFDITKKISVTFYEEGNPGGIHTDLSSIIFNGSPMGVLTGSSMSHVSGLDVSILDGTGYIQGTSSEGIVKNLHYIGESGVIFTTNDNSSEYIYLYDESGDIYSTSSLPDTEQNIMLGRVVTSNGEVIFIDRSPITSKHQSNKNTNFIRQAIGSVYEYGSVVTESASTFELDVTPGSYFFGNTNFKPSGGDSITFKQFYRNVIAEWDITSTSTVTQQYENSGVLTSLTSGYFTKHSLYVVSDGSEEQYLLVVGQNEYPTQLEAELADSPTPPDYFIEGVTLLANIYIEESLTSISTIEDMRNLGFKSSARSSEIDKVNSSVQLVKDNYLPLTGGSVTGTFSSDITELKEVIEVINSQPTGATAATVVYDISGGNIFYHGTASTNFTANFTNLPTTNNRAITATIVLSQGPTAYVPNVVQIEGTTKTVKWAGGTYSGTANGVDIIGFTFIRSSNDWAQVLGQINTFS